MSEEILIRQGAPTLAGIKTGSLFPCPCDDREALLTDVRRLNRQLVPKGLCLLPIRFKDGQALLYLYRPAVLHRDLQDGLAQRILTQAGYACGGCGRCVAQLIRRFREVASSPTRWDCFSATRRRTCRASSTTAPATSSVRGCGRYTATRSGPSGCSPASSAAPRTTAPAGRPVTTSASWQWPCNIPLKRDGRGTASVSFSRRNG